MTILTRLEQWKERGIISPEQHTLLAGLSRGEPFSLFLELNILLYAGILAFVAGLGWTVSTWSQQLGDVLVLTILSAMLAACFWYCFSRAPAWSPGETPSPSLVFDYVLYLGSLTWSVELAYLENRFHVLSGQWDLYLLATAGLFFFLAYRFDNRFVLSLALSSLAGWFGLTISHWPSHQDADVPAICDSLQPDRRRRRSHTPAPRPETAFLRHLSEYRGQRSFLGTALRGLQSRRATLVWLLALLAACGASLAWGLARRQFSFVAYAAVYGYVGVSSILIRNMNGETAVLSYFVVTGVAMLVMLVLIARRFGREA